MKTGLDPEVLVMTSDDYIIPASDFLPPPTRDSNGILNPISYDNAAIEIRPKESASLKSLTKNALVLFRDAKQHVKRATYSALIPWGCKISLAPAGHLSSDYVNYESVKTFGCSPSKVVNNDLTIDISFPKLGPDDTTVRSAGYHIHQEVKCPEGIPLIVAILDATLGLADAVVCIRKWRKASLMRRLTLGYGVAGEHRVRTSPTGNFILEYRTMSPWPIANRRSIKWTTHIMKRICIMDLSTLFTIYEDLPDRSEITEAINQLNPTLLSKLPLPLPLKVDYHVT